MKYIVYCTGAETSAGIYKHAFKRIQPLQFIREQHFFPSDKSCVIRNSSIMLKRGVLYHVSALYNLFVTSSGVGVKILYVKMMQRDTVLARYLHQQRDDHIAFCV